VEAWSTKRVSGGFLRWVSQGGKVKKNCGVYLATPNFLAHFLGVFPLGFIRGVPKVSGSALELPQNLTKDTRKTENITYGTALRDWQHKSKSTEKKKIMSRIKRIFL